jgi:hypothetical protein
MPCNAHNAAQCPQCRATPTTPRNARNAVQRPQCRAMPLVAGKGAREPRPYGVAPLPATMFDSGVAGPYGVVPLPATIFDAGVAPLPATLFNEGAADRRCRQQLPLACGLKPAMKIGASRLFSGGFHE